MSRNYERYQRDTLRDTRSVHSIIGDPKGSVRESHRLSQYQTSGRQMSSLLPKGVLVTLRQKEELLDIFKLRCRTSKQQLSTDLDSCLKEIILVFEEFKQQLFGKIDDHFVAFSNLFAQFENLSVECSEWAEQRMSDSENLHHTNPATDDMLYHQLTEARLRKQKADENEKALLAIKQKIDQLKLNELNNDILILTDEKNPEIYSPTDTLEFTNRLKKELREKLTRIDHNRLIRPFIIDQKSLPKTELGNLANARTSVITNQSDLRQTAALATQRENKFEKTQEDNFQYRTFESQAVSSPYKATADNFAYTDQNKDIPADVPLPKKAVGPIIAQQNQFLSDDIDLTNPVVNQQSEIVMKNNSRVNCLVSITNKVILCGSEDGSLVIVDITQDPNGINQLLVKAHNAGVRGLNKANETLVLSSSEMPDTTLKLWDISSVTDFTQTNNNPGKFSNSVTLVSVLKGLVDTPIGHGFINDRIVLAAAKDGTVCVWDWKMTAPISQYATKIPGVISFLMFSDKESFALGTSEGSVIAFSIVKNNHGYDFVKQSEIQESLPILNIHSFRGNNDIAIVTLSSGEVKLLSKKSKVNYHTIVGCKTPLAYLVLTWVKADPNIYLMALEPYGFKIADIDGKDFANVAVEAKSNFRFEGNGWPCWQIIDSIPKKKIIFATINSSALPNSVIIWALEPAFK